MVTKSYVRRVTASFLVFLIIVNLLGCGTGLKVYAQDAGVSPDVLKFSFTENVNVLQDATLNLTLLIEVPASSLAEVYRKIFGAPSAGVGEEVEIPEHKSDPLEIEIGQDVTAMELNGTEVVTPVREMVYESISREHLASLGFTMDIFDSKMVPWGYQDEFRVYASAYASPRMVNITQSGSDDIWAVDVGPVSSMAFAGFTFFKVAMIQQMLEALPEQVYESVSTTVFNLPSGATLLNRGELMGLNWFVDFGGGTCISASVSVGETVVLHETLVVTEGNVTEAGSLVEAFSGFKVFRIEYLLPHSVLAQSQSMSVTDAEKPGGDFSLSWSVSTPKIELPWKQKLLEEWGDLTATITVSSQLNISGYLGWEPTFPIPFFDPLQWFEAWIKPELYIGVKLELEATKIDKTFTWEIWSGKYQFMTLIGGVVPFWVDFYANLTANLNVFFDGHLLVTTGAEARGGFRVGGRWNSESGWQAIWEPYLDFGYTLPTVEFEGKAGIKPYLQLELGALLYSVVGPVARFILYVLVQVTTSFVIEWVDDVPQFFLKKLELLIKVWVDIDFAIMPLVLLKPLLGWLISGMDDFTWTLFSFTIKEWKWVWLHDVAITSVSAFPTKAGKGQKVYIDVGVQNQGNFTESFLVVTYYDLITPIGGKSVSLGAGDSTTLTFEWDTTDVPVGTHTISALANPVRGEEDLADNLFEDGTVEKLDTIPPTVSVSHSPSSPTDATYVTFSITASDDAGLSTVTLYWNDGSWHEYSTTLQPGVKSFSTQKVTRLNPWDILYYATATDIGGNQIRDPVTGYKTFRVVDDDWEGPLVLETSIEPDITIIYDNFIETLEEKEEPIIRFRVKWFDSPSIFAEKGSGILDATFGFWIDIWGEAPDHVDGFPPTGKEVDKMGNGWYWYDMEVSRDGLIFPTGPLGFPVEVPWWKIVGGRIYWYAQAWDGDDDRLGDYEYTSERLDGPYIRDDDETGPSITNVRVEEYDGDGDGIIQDDEKVKISWEAWDKSGIMGVKCFVDGIRWPVQEYYAGPDTQGFFAIVNQLSIGIHNLTIDAKDEDHDWESERASDSATSSYSLLFEVFDDDSTPPTGSNPQPPDAQTYRQDYPDSIRLQVTWTDESGIGGVLFMYRYTEPDGWWREALPTGQTGNTYWYDIPRTEWTQHVGYDIQWYCEAWDNDIDGPWADQLWARFPDPPYTIHLVPLFDVSIDPTTRTIQPGSSGLYTVSITNLGSQTDTYSLTLSGLNPTWYKLSQTTVTVGAGQTVWVTLTVSPPRASMILKDYPFTVTATSQTPPNARDSANAVAVVDFKPTLPATPTGGLAIAVQPKATYMSAGTKMVVNILVINNQNFDDAIRVDISNSGIPIQYQANLAWFNWTTVKVFIPSGSSIKIPLEISGPVDVPIGSYIFRAIATSTAKPTITAKDSGIIKVT